MPTREEMRSLAEDIVGSYEDRIVGIAQLRETVKMDLKGFQDSRTAMAKELRADLSKVRPTLAEDDRQRQSEAHEFMGELGRVVAEGKATVKTLLNEFDSAHQVMSNQLRADLAKDDRQRQSEAHEFMGELGRVVAEGKAAVKTLLNEFDSAHQAMSNQLRADLAKDEEGRLRQARALKQELVRGVAEIKSAVSAQLKEFADIQAGARDEWQILSATMQAQRVGPVVETKPSEAFAAPAEEITEEEVAELTPETADIRHRVFEYLANHPDGTKMTGLEEEFGLARIQIAKIVKSLMGENKVEKRELFYFAI